jgi:hypothetical protein
MLRTAANRRVAVEIPGIRGDCRRTTHQLDEGNGVDDVIVISGILLLIAVVFLVIGLFGPLAWVYASIAVSVLSFVFLLVGVRQRRDVPVAATSLTPAAPRGGAPEAADAADVTLVPAAGRRPSEAAATGGAAAAGTAAVLAERAESAPARVVERRPAATTRRPARPGSAPASSRLRGATSDRPRAVLPARLADQEAAPAKKTAKKAAPAKAAAKKAAPAKKTTAKKAAPAAKKAAPAKKSAPAKKTAAKKAAPAKAAAKKAPAKKTAKKTAR